MSQEAPEPFTGPLAPVDHSYWVSDCREEAEEAGSLIVNTLLRIKADIPNIHIIDPCHNCNREDFRIDLGRLSVAEANDLASKIKKALDELDLFRRSTDSDGRRELGRVPESVTANP
ncbi:hypothetical protein [Streptomyces nigrescens]